MAHILIVEDEICSSRYAGNIRYGNGESASGFFIFIHKQINMIEKVI